MIGLARGQGLNLEETDYWNKVFRRSRKGWKVKDDDAEEGFS